MATSGSQSAQGLSHPMIYMTLSCGDPAVSSDIGSVLSGMSRPEQARELVEYIYGAPKYLIEGTPGHWRYNGEMDAYSLIMLGDKQLRATVTLAAVESGHTLDEIMAIVERLAPAVGPIVEIRPAQMQAYRQNALRKMWRNQLAHPKRKYLGEITILVYNRKTASEQVPSGYQA